MVDDLCAGRGGGHERFVPERYRIGWIALYTIDLEDVFAARIWIRNLRCLELVGAQIKAVGDTI